MKKHIITLAGKPGSGKSSTANLVAKELGYTRYSSGDFMRAIAVRHGMTLNELQHFAETHPEIDEEIDEENRKAGEKSDLVIDARLAWFFIPESFKVYLDLDLAISAQRIHADATDVRVASGEAADPDTLERLLAERLASERERYEKLYGVNHLDLSQYDLVIDTKRYPLEEVATRIVEAYRKWLGEQA